MVCPGNVCNRAEVADLVRLVVKEWDRIDVLINVAGVKREGPVEGVGTHDAMETLQVNYLGALACCQAVLPTMRAQKVGQIINVSSVLGRRATPLRGAYAASKAALNAMTEAMRVELMGSGIVVTLVCPGRLVDRETTPAPRFAMSNERAARSIVRCAEHPRRELVLTWSGRVLVWLGFWAPGLLDRILCRARRSEI
jgi:NAD(P)-dependent dehydrogenase (short-subunit alcohol dehydrogenase family)